MLKIGCDERRFEKRECDKNAFAADNKLICVIVACSYNLSVYREPRLVGLVRFGEGCFFGSNALAELNDAL